MSGAPSRPVRVLKESSAFVDDLLRARREARERNYRVNQTRVANLLHNLHGRPTVPVPLETILIPSTTPDGKGLPRPPTDQERRAVSLIISKKNFFPISSSYFSPLKFLFRKCGLFPFMGMEKKIVVFLFLPFFFPCVVYGSCMSFSTYFG